MNFGKFIVLTIAGTIIWNGVLVYVGSLAGDSWESIADFMDIYARLALAILVLLAVLMVYIFYKKRFSPK